MRWLKVSSILPTVTRRGAFGRCHASSAQNRPPVREGESTGQKEKQDGKKRRKRTRSAASSQSEPAATSVARYLAGSKIAIAPRPPSPYCWRVAASSAFQRRHAYTRHATRLLVLLVSSSSSVLLAFIVYSSSSIEKPALSSALSACRVLSVPLSLDHQLYRVLRAQ